MPLIQLVLVLVVVGVILWVINRYIPMQSTIKNILNVVVVIVVIIWILNVFGLIGNLSHDSYREMKNLKCKSATYPPIVRTQKR